LSLTPGTRLGPYEVVARLGAGGMGEVYRATDTNLKRPVALKVLPDDVAEDPRLIARFQREAELLASLHHPNIASIYGLERSGPTTAIVMELVEGEDLNWPIAAGPMPLDEALPIGRQIADALEAAHEQNIIHRDLKPGNIKVRADGVVKVLDFGLAKAISGTASGEMEAFDEALATSPAMTMRGAIVGTAAYMPPEQAKGRPIDRRADIWAFGTILYEMLTGARAFPGEHSTETLAAVIAGDPDWSLLPSTTPAQIRTLLRRCLERDPKRRLDSAAAIKLEIEDALTAPERAPAPSAPSFVTRPQTAWLIALAALAGLIGTLAVWAPWRSEPDPPELRTDIVTPATDDSASFALSPDGRQIVFSASGDGTLRLWLRSLGATTAQPLPGTEGGRYPFWSPDSRAIGFFTDTALKRLELAGGAPQTISTASSGAGGTWMADGSIVFAPSPSSALMRVPASGGAPAPVTSFVEQQIGHRWPEAIPGGHRFVFYAGGPPDTAGIYLGSLDGAAPTRLTPAESAGVFHPGGWLLWVRAGALVAQRLDVDKAALAGEQVTVADSAAVDNSERSAVSVATNGVVAYRTGSASQRQLAWFDRAGQRLDLLGEADATWGRPRVSPDGQRVVIGRTVQGNQDLWILDGTRANRFTFDAATDDIAIWSPDGSRIVFDSTRTGGGDLYERPTSGAELERQFITSPEVKTPSSWSADGRYVLFHSTDPQTSSDLWVADLGHDGTTRPPATTVFLNTPAREVWGAFSPDGRWVAYMSNESGRPEIYVRPFTAPGAAQSGVQWQVSTAGGIHPVWRFDGRELYYIDPVGAMVAAPITVTGNTVQPGIPLVLFSTRILGGGVDAGQGRQYDLTRDGRFLINTVLQDVDTPITLLQNWRPH
jgi:eukaryotic-like serine/threonine-protein kinase